MIIYNTLKRQKERFIPLEPGKVRMYVCGITAYDFCHIGHARSCVVFDVLVRYLRFLGFKVLFVRNFTDVDDKIIKKAQEEGLSSMEVAEKYIQAFYEDMGALNILRADIEPRATEHIQEMVRLTAKLLEKGYAYVTSKGDIYFRVRKISGYGQLSGRNIEELQAGTRIALDEDKEDQLDFALWKAAKPGETSWDSPWGAGRPGWHLECSAMSEKYLGIPFDIHGGGQDLAFPHHENERAQSKAAFDGEFVKYWVHNGFVRVNAEKMSKSLGNFVTIRDILAAYHGEVLRFFLLTNHYRSPLDFSDTALQEAEKALKKIYWTKSALEKELEKHEGTRGEQFSEAREEFQELTEKWNQAMQDDLNTAQALGYVFGLVRLANRMLDIKSFRKNEPGKTLMHDMLDALKKWGEVLGVFLSPGPAFLEQLKIMRCRRQNIDPQAINKMVQKRQEARKEKNFEAADRIRQELAELGIEVMDTPDGPVWDFA